ncbi:hypothetical protein DMUE_1694 [Dictyocoela muelleri]|nr:hypothetical protein DMUE_1694 [Dictyocoela muelleri]
MKNVVQQREFFNRSNADMTITDNIVASLSNDNFQFDDNFHNIDFVVSENLNSDISEPFYYHIKKLEEALIYEDNELVASSISFKQSYHESRSKKHMEHYLVD